LQERALIVCVLPCRRPSFQDFGTPCRRTRHLGAQPVCGRERPHAHGSTPGARHGQTEKVGRRSRSPAKQPGRSSPVLGHDSATVWQAAASWFLPSASPAAMPLPRSGYIMAAAWDPEEVASTEQAGEAACKWGLAGWMHACHEVRRPALLPLHRCACSRSMCGKAATLLARKTLCVSLGARRPCRSWLPRASA
jgi:hypothetical protein